MRKEHLLQEMTDIVKSCEDILLSATDMERKIHRKTGKGNFVTDYDSKVQAILQSRLLELLPEAVFLGEEDQMDSTDISKGYAFIVDPIDGTANFTRNYHASCISVALALDGFPILGVVHNPYLKETFTALKGQGVEVGTVGIDLLHVVVRGYFGLCVDLACAFILYMYVCVDGKAANLGESHTAERQSVLNFQQVDLCFV